jgi:hypothetical protein
VSLGNLRNGLNVCQLQCRVSGALDQNDAGFRSNRGFDVDGVGCVHKG